MPEDLRDALERAAAELGPFAGRVRYYAEVASTNDVAIRLAEAGAPEGTTVIADAQSAGRGRFGRSWLSPPGAGLYVSIVFRPPALDGLTLMTGVALADAIRGATGLPVALKWPNDLVVADAAAASRHRKLGGILAEASGAEPVAEQVILGFGINVARTSYPPELAARATSLETELGRAVDRAPVLVATLAALARWRDAVRAGRLAFLLDRWRALAVGTRGARVEVAAPDGPRVGTTEGIDDDGALLVRLGGRLERIVAGEVRWL